MAASSLAEGILSVSRPAALFDLDGTLVESGHGIVANVRHAMAHIGRPLDPDRDLTWAIGPPLRDIFARLLDPADDLLVEEAARTYRATYDSVGLLATVLYPGIPEALDAFAAAGWRLFVATSKPASVARRILTRLSAADRFEAIYGSVEDGALAHKPELLGYLMVAQGLSRRRTIMVGDRSFDIAGAHANDLRAIGVLWGYGGLAELEQAGADALAERPEAVAGLAAGLLDAPA
jgi:phosphoglycolate phosphatase